MFTSFTSGGLWSRLLGRGPRKYGLDLLPADIIVDEIMFRLDVKDIFSLRRVNKTLCLITRQPAIWKRLLPYFSSIEHPLAAMPPTAKYTAGPLSALAIERIVTRAVSLDNNWRGDAPKPFETTSYETYHRVLAMVLLPGGHYMVASVLNRAGQYAIMVWSMDHPALGGAIPLAMRYTDVKPYYLQAKYMSVSGRKGIVIAFLRKRHKNKHDKRDIPESLEMGGEAEPEDPFMPLRYECTTMHISLESLDLLTDRRLHPGTDEFEDVARMQGDAITVVSRIRTGTQLGAVTLEEVDNQPFVAVVKRPNRIVIQNLSSKALSTLECRSNQHFPDLRHSIWNIRFIPAQRQILVLRTVEKPPNSLTNPHLFEMFVIPESNKAIAHPVDCKIALYHGIVNMQISELQSTPAQDTSVWSQLNAARPPPPFTIYCRKDRDSVSLIIISIWPVRLEVPLSPPNTPNLGKSEKGKRRSPVYHYSTATVTHQNTLKMPARLNWGTPRVLPGAHRALVYSVPCGFRGVSPPLMGMYAYMSPEHGSHVTQYGVGADHGVGQTAQDVGEEDAEEGKEGHERVERELRERGRMVWPEQRKRARRRALPSVLMHPYLVEQVRKGVSAIAWDEGSGRVCVASTQDGQLHIMDFAYQRNEDDVDKAFYREMDRPLAVTEPIEVD